MKLKYAIIAILFILLLGAGVGLKMFFKPHADISQLEPNFKVEGVDFINEFKKDENAATSKYSEKVIEIKGKLVAKNILPNGINLLILEDEMEGISCELDGNWAKDNQPLIQRLKTGDPVTVKGVCKGFLMEVKVSPAVVEVSE
jgi:hypothetical protein